MKSQGMNALLVAFALSLSFAAAGCAHSSTAQSPGVEKAIADVKELAGTWQGWVTDQVGSQTRVLMTITADGSYESSASAAGGTLTRGKFFLENGKLRYRSSRTQGAVTVLEDRGRTFLTQTPEGTVNVNTGRATYERVK